MRRKQLDWVLVIYITILLRWPYFSPRNPRFSLKFSSSSKRQDLRRVQFVIILGSSEWPTPYWRNYTSLSSAIQPICIPNFDSRDLRGWPIWGWLYSPYGLQFTHCQTFLPPGFVRWRRLVGYLVRWQLSQRASLMCCIVANWCPITNSPFVEKHRFDESSFLNGHICSWSSSVLLRHHNLGVYNRVSSSGEQVVHLAPSVLW